MAAKRDQAQQGAEGEVNREWTRMDANAHNGVVAEEENLAQGDADSAGRGVVGNGNFF